MNSITPQHDHSTAKSTTKFTADNYTSLIQQLTLRELRLSAERIAAHRQRHTASGTLSELQTITTGHQQYLSLQIDPTRLCGVQPATTLPEDILKNRAPAGKTILSSQEHFHADVVVARCMDNRCSSPNVELNKLPHQVCEVVSAGHILVEKDLESLAVGVALKGAKVILVEAHGGECGAVKLALSEKHSGTMEHAITEDITKGLGKHAGIDTPDVFGGTLENLSEQIGKIMNPDLQLPLLLAKTGKPNFYALEQAGQCLVVGVFVDFEVLNDPATGEKLLIKRLTFFDSNSALDTFMEEKRAAYFEHEHSTTRPA